MQQRATTRDCPYNTISICRGNPTRKPLCEMIYLKKLYFMNNYNLKIIILSSTILTTAVCVLSAILVWLLYETAFEGQQERLVETAQSEARLIEAIAHFYAKHNPCDLPGGTFAVTLSQIIDAHEHYKGFGETGEFTLARREEEQIVFLLRHRHFDLENPQPVPFQSHLAEPMRKALLGQSGTMIGLDYREERVLAAYEPVPILNIGIVAKIDMAEIRAPFIRMGWIAMAITLLIIVVAVWAFLRIVDPIIIRMIKTKTYLRTILEHSNQLTERLSSIVDSLPVIPYTCKREEYFAATYVGKNIKEVTGYETEEFVSDAYFWVNNIHPDDVERVFKNIQAEYHEYRFKIANGSYKWFGDTVHLIKEADGRITHRAGVLQDITERKLAEEKLRDNETRLSAILENMVDGVITIDENAIIESFNPAAEHIFGYSADQVLGKNLNILMPESYRSEHCLKLIGVGKEVVGQHKDGSIFPLDIAVSNIRLDNRLKFVGIVRNITERKQTERLQKEYSQTLESEVFERTQELREAREAAETANRAKSVFIATMSHELRTPLNGILGYAQILKMDSSLGPDQQDGIKIIEQSGKHLLTLLNDILDLAKIEAGKIEINKSHFHLRALLREISEMVHIRAEHKDIFLIYDPHDSLPNCVYGDEKRLRQVLINLVGNAVKFTDKGGVTFKVGVLANHKLRFQIEDTGVGIAPEQLQDIFNPFQQVGDKTRQAEGTGLGLAISRHLIELMGSQLEVTSQLGEGSTFWFELVLPEVINFKKEINNNPTRWKIIGIKNEKPTLLIVDAQSNNRAILVDLLSPLGFETIEASDGREALAKAFEFQPQAILTDLFMPEMDGFELTRQIRQSLKDIVVIAISASVFEEDQQKSLAAGCHDFLPKPINAKQLFEQLQRHLVIEWIYEEVPSLIVSQAPLVPPPQETVVSLYELAMGGDVRAVEERVSQLTDEQFVPFVAKMQDFINNLQVDDMCDWLESYKTA